MPSHFTTIGFPIRSEHEVLEYAQKALENGEHLEARSGWYVRWNAGNGAELWARLDHGGNQLLGHGLHPHFSGEAVAHVGLMERVPDREAGSLEGGFFGWVNSYDDPVVFGDPESDYTHRVAEGDYPLVFDAPDYDLHRNVELRATLDVQLAGFAHELQAYADDEAYRATGSRFAAESFVPSGLFRPAGEAVDPPEAYAIVTGHVLGTSLLTNPATGAEFYWAKVRTFGECEVDVVIDPEVIEGTLVEGGVIQGSLWLSGRIL
jgi:hypothetical protein